MPTICNDISKDDEETDTDVSENEEEISTSMAIVTPTQSRRREMTRHRTTDYAWSYKATNS